MAKSIADYDNQIKAELDRFRITGGAEIEKFKTKNGIVSEPAAPIPDYNQPNLVEYQPNTLASHRVPKANTATDVLKDTANAVGSGLLGAASGAASSVALAGSGYKMMYDMATEGSTDVDTDLTIHNTKQALGLNQAKEHLQANESELVKGKRAAFDRIMKNTEMGDGAQAAAVANFYKENPDMLLLDTAKVLPQSVVEMYTGGKVVGGIRGLNKMSSAVKVGAATSGTVFGNAISEAAEDPNNDVDPRTILAAAAKGLTVGGLTGGFAKLHPNADMDTILAGMAGNSTRSIKNVATGAPVEALEEFSGEYAEKVIDNWDKGARLDEGALAAGTQGAFIGATANTATSLPGALGSAATDVGNAIEQRDVKKNGTPEENVDIASDKFNPAKAYKDALYMSGSDNVEERNNAELTIAAASKAVYSRVSEMEAEIENEPDIAKQTKLINDLIAFEEKYVAPLEAEVRNHINNVRANKAEIIEKNNKSMSQVSEMLGNAAESRAARYDSQLEDTTTSALGYVPTRDDSDVTVTDTDNTSSMSDDQLKTWEISKRAVGKVPHFKEASEKYGVPMRVITAIVATESGGKFSAVSPTGAVGLLQHTGVFREEYGLSKGDSIGVTPAAVEATVKDLARSYAEFGNWDDAILAYNAGRGGVRSYKNGTFKGSPERIAEVEGYVGKVRGYLGGGVQGSSPNSGDGFVSNDKLKGLNIKADEATANGKVRGYTADFAHITQNLLGDGLKYFSSFNDTYHKGKGGRHPKGQAFDVVLKDGSSIEDSKTAVAKIKQAAKEQGYSIKILNEYTDPSANATGGHIHVTVSGRTKAAKGGTEDTIELEEEVIDPLDIKFDEEVDITEEEAAAENVDTGTANEEQVSKAKRDLVSVLSAEEIEKSKFYSQAQKVALRKLLGIKEKIKAGKDIDKVSEDIYKGSKGATTLESNLGIQQYEEVITHSISTNDVETADKYLGMLDNFVDNHASKNQIIKDNIGNATRENPLTIAPDESNVWGIVDRSSYTEEEFKKAGGLSFDGPNKLTKAIESEAKDLAEFRESMGVLSSTLIGTQTPVISSPVETPTTPVESTDPVEATNTPAPTPTATVPTIETAEVDSETPTVVVNPATTYKSDDDKVEDAIYISDDTFGFNEKNQYGLNVATDETLEQNKQAIDKVLATAQTGNVMFPETGVGANLKVNAPKTYKYLQEALQSNLGVDNDALLTNAPREVVEKRSAVKTKAKVKGVASNPIKPQQGSNELNENSTVGKRGYRNNYTGPAKNGSNWSLSITRKKSDNRVAKVVLDTIDLEGNNTRTALEFDPMMSDGDIIDQVESDNNIVDVLQEADGSAQSVDPTPEMDSVRGRTFPKELRQATELEGAMDTLMDYVESETISEKERKLYTSIIKPILNFNPSLKIRLSETVKASSYDKSNNTIYVKVNARGSNIMQETTRMVVYSATANLVIRLQDSSYENIKAEGKELVKLNYDLSKAKRDIQRIVTLSGKQYMGLSAKEKARLLEALSSNDKLLGAVVSDPAIGKFLRSVQVTEGKVKSSVFRKITNSLRSFFNIAPNDQTATLYDRMMDITSRTVELQAKNKEVSFKASEQGKATIFQDVIKEEVELEREKVFYKRNQLLAGFRQNVSKSKPLSGVSNLASKLKIDLMQGLGSLVSESPTKAQREQVVDFLAYRDELSQHLLDTFARKGTSKKTGADFNYQDLKGFLQVDGEIDENVLTSVALATYNWAIEFGNQNKTSDDGIKKFLNLDVDQAVYIPPEIRSQYEFLTEIRSYSTLSLGKTAASALNIKATDFVKLEAQSAFESSLGEWALNAMQSANLIHAHSIPTKQHMANIEAVGGDTKITTKGGQVKELNNNGVVHFISVSGPKGGQKNRRLEEIAFKNRGTLGYMEKLFGTEIGLRAPSLVPIDEVKTTIKRTKSITSAIQTKFMKKMQDEPISIDEDMYNSLNHLISKDRDTTLQMIGAKVTEEELAKEHKDDRASKESAAEGVMRDYNNMTDFIGSLPRTASGLLARFYDGVYGAKNNRMHYNSNMFNFQSSLLHRAVGQYDNFKTTVELDGLREETPNFFQEDGQLLMLGLFYKALGERAEGTEKIIEKALAGTKYSKGFTQDKIPGDVFIPAFHEYLTTDPLVAEAVAAATTLLTNPKAVTKADTAKIAELVEAWEGGAESLRGLLEYTKLVIAMENGDTSIDTHIGIHSDGVNNGIALANVLLGTGTERFLSQVGMFTKGSKYTNFFDTRVDKDLQDYYEGFGTVLKDVFTSNWNEGKDKLDADGNMSDQAVLLSLNTSFFERANMKALLIPFGYSAGMKRIKSLAYGQFLQDIKKTMKGLSTKDFSDPKVVAEHKMLKDKLEYLSGKQIDLPTGKDILEFWFDTSTINALGKKYESELGGVVQRSMEVYAKDFIDQRNLNVKLQNAASEVYLAMRDNIKAKADKEYVQTLVDSGMSKKDADNLFKAEGMPAKYFIENVAPKLQAILPTVKTPYNHSSENGEGNFIMLEETSTAAQDKGSKSLGYRVNEAGMLAEASTALPIREQIEKSVGVFGNSAQVQGMDAYIAGWTSAFGGNVNINVHDAGISGLSNFRDMVNMQNKATFEGLRDYASQTESLKTMVTTFKHAADMVSSGDMDLDTYVELLTKNIDAINNSKTGVQSIDSINENIQKIVKDVRQSQSNKIEIIRNLETVHQYAGEGAPYRTSESDTKLIDTAEKRANETLDSLLYIVDTNNALVGENTDSKGTETAPIEESIGTAANTKTTGFETISNLFNEFKQEAGESFEAIDSMVDYIMNRLGDVNPDINFQWQDSIKGPVKGAVYNGYYTIQGNNVILSRSAFRNMAPYDRTTVLAHELIHAVSAYTVVNSNNPTTRLAIKELNKMLQELKAVNQTEFTVTKELENVEELIAYGLTDAKFLKFIGDNLKGEYKSPTRASKGLVRFIKAVSAFFSGNKKFNKNIDTFMRLADAVTKEDFESSKQVGINYNFTKPSDVLKSLDSRSVSSEFNEHLDGLIDEIITPSYESSAEAGQITEDVISKVSKRALKAGFKLSDKELHVMEILKAVGTTYLDKHSGSNTAAKMNKIYDNVLRQLSVDSFLPDPANATAQERALAKKKYGYIVNNDNLNKKEHLERLYALSLASQEFRDVLNKQENSIKADVQEGWFNKIMAVFADMVGWITSKYMNTNGLSTPAELGVLFKRLANIDAKATANKQHMIDNVYEAVTGFISTPLNYTTNKLVASMFGVLNFTASRTTAISGLSAALNATDKARKTGLMNLVGQVVENDAAKGRDGSNRLSGFAEILNELARTQGMKQTVEEMIRAVSKAGQLRNTVKNKTKSIIQSYFKDNAKNVDGVLLDSLTQVALRTDMSSLMNNGFSIKQVIRLLSNDNELADEIAKYETKLSKVPNGNDILMQTKSLGLYMAKETATEHMVKNAENIAIGLGSWYQTDMSVMDTNLRDDIDVLASLYAVSMVDKNKRNSLKQLIKQDQGGVEATLKAHRDMAKRGKEDFADNPYNYSKGYIPQETHHLRSLKFASTLEEIETLKRAGWVEITQGDLKQDRHDKTDARTLMFHNDISYQDYVSGALDMKDTHAKGTIVYDEGGIKELKRVEAAKLSERRKRAATEQYMDFNPAKSKRGVMIANYASEGSLISYGYEMGGELRDTYLERNNNAVDLLGIYESNLQFKPEIKGTQEELARRLFEDFKAGYSNDPRQFVTLDPNSKDENVRTMYRMMPYAFRAEATKLFGEGNPIVVRSNVYNSVFGFRTYSMSQMFEKTTGEKNAIELVITSVMDAIFKDKAQMRAIQGERSWQYAISQIKDFVVIRNIKVLMGNITANSLLLSLEGVPPVQQAKDFVSVWRNGGQYRKLASRVIEIETEISVNQNRPNKLKELKRERSKAMRAMERNPMHEFMQAGLMSTIVEDVKVGKDDTAFKTDLEKKLEELSDKIPEQIVEGFNWAVTNPGTPLHDFMAHATQFSDLAAKYSLTTKLMREGKSMQDAIAVAQDNFINYDVPTSQGLDYMNKMGLFMFTKFFIRFQQVMIRKLNEKAGSTIAQHIGVEHFTGLAGVLDPFALGRIGNNPFTAGAFNYDEAFKNITTVDAITGMF